MSVVALWLSPIRLTAAGWRGAPMLRGVVYEGLLLATLDWFEVTWALGLGGKQFFRRPNNYSPAALLHHSTAIPTT